MVKAKHRETKTKVIIKLHEFDFNNLAIMKNLVKEIQLLKHFTEQMDDNIFTIKLHDIILAESKNKKQDNLSKS